MQSLDNLFPRANGHEKRRRPALHFAWRPWTAGFRIMALLEDGSTMLVRLVENLHEIRSKGEAAASDIAAERNRYSAAMRDNSRSIAELEAIRPSVVSLYTERWAGTLTAGSWQTMSDKDGGFYQSFRKLAAPPRHGRRRQQRVRV